MTNPLSPAEMIARARARSGLTQLELSEKIGTSPGFISKLEHGRSLPSYELCLVLENVLGSDVLNARELWAAVQEYKRQEIERKVRVRGAAIRGISIREAPGAAFYSRGVRPTSGTLTPPWENTPPDYVTSETAADPEFARALEDLKKAMSDRSLRPAVLAALKAFAETARTRKSQD